MSKYIHLTNSVVSFLRKKSFLAVVISILLFSFTGCGAGETKETSAPKTDAPKETAAVETENKDQTKKALTLATTTSVNDTGLLDYLRPEFEKDTGITLKVISQGTGQAIKTGEDGNADVLLIHSKSAEEKFVADGFGLERIELMYNYFVIVGPKDDPAGILNSSGEKYTAAQTFEKISQTKSNFVSRGDDSGTHKKELSIWKNTKIEPADNWYISAGKGMGAVLSMASEKKAYTLTDKATYLSMKDKLDLQIVVDASDDLFNQYTIIQVNPDKHEGINKEGADAFTKWMTSEKVLKMIDDFGKDKYGDSLFKVNYKKN
ncbi:substrate-binding domain-containing protein [Petroclostridium sp. X23]|uniref:substrate-binding domain-containing protein n=1 Tax=Petroclostridium sp. X23 TaxID=3045146 RepID=UPI0024AD1735|nr:substrate-binding domain-containing protein [Petroclostridium sp. X23]WHH58806.1 substrate-binding domain-containing protein [Petroclostridium sp. X23]